MPLTPAKVTLTVTLILLLVSNFSQPILAGINGYINLYVTNCAEGDETPTADYYAEACNSNESSGKINGSIYYEVTDESNQVVCSLCVITGKLEPGECFVDSSHSCTFSTQGNKTFTATFYESPNCTGKILDTDSTQCYFIPTLGKILLSIFIMTLVGISLHRRRKA